MKYQTEEALSQIRQRSRQFRRKREKQRIRLLACTSVVLFGALVFMIAGISKQVRLMSGMTVMGAFLLSAESGAYILTAVAAFIIGVVITMLTQKYRNKKK